MNDRRGDAKTPAALLPGPGPADLQHRRWLRALSAVPVAAGFAAPPATAAMQTNAPMVIAGVGVLGILTLPSLTGSSLGELKCWVDGLALAGQAGAFALLTAALLLPLTTLLMQQPT
jgi:hypothetical protein